MSTRSHALIQRKPPTLPFTLFLIFLFLLLLNGSKWVQNDLGLWYSWFSCLRYVIQLSNQGLSLQVQPVPAKACGGKNVGVTYYQSVVFVVWRMFLLAEKYSYGLKSTYAIYLIKVLHMVAHEVSCTGHLPTKGLVTFLKRGPVELLLDNSIAFQSQCTTGPSRLL